MKPTRHGDNNKREHGPASVGNVGENRVQPIFDAPPPPLSFDERQKWAYRREDGVLMVLDLDTPFLPDGSGNYVPLPKPLNQSIPCEAIALGDPTPDDSFVAASKVSQEHFTQYTAFKRFLEKHPEIRTRKPSKQRLLVHAGDWFQYWAKREQEDLDKLDSLTPEAFTRLTDGIEQRKHEVDSEKTREEP